MAAITGGNAYVDTDLGTDDASHGTSVGTGACKSLKYLLVYRVTTLVSALTVSCSGSGEDALAASCSVTGHTTTASNTITIIGNSVGAWDASKYVISFSTGAPITIAEPYVTLRNIQTYGKGGIAVNNASCDVISISKCLVKGNAVDYATAISISNGVASSVVSIFNNVIYGFSGVEGTAISLAHANPTLKAFNNTCVGNTRGLRQTAGTLIAINNIVKDSGNTNSYLGIFDASTDYNVTDGTDVTGQGAHSHTGHTFSFVSTTPGSEDYHLVSTDVGAIGLGLADPGSGLFADDIDGVARGATWDCGADQYTAPPAAPTLKNRSLLGVGR
jgi:hypothetical protein